MCPTPIPGERDACAQLDPICESMCQFWMWSIREPFAVLGHLWTIRSILFLFSIPCDPWRSSTRPGTKTDKCDSILRWLWWPNFDCIFPHRRSSPQALNVRPIWALQWAHDISIRRFRGTCDQNQFHRIKWFEMEILKYFRFHLLFQEVLKQLLTTNSNLVFHTQLPNMCLGYVHFFKQLVSLDEFFTTTATRFNL